MNKLLYFLLGIILIITNYCCYMGFLHPFSVSGGFAFILSLTIIGDIYYLFKTGGFIANIINKQ